jgi:hypothetical protein
MQRLLPVAPSAIGRVTSLAAVDDLLGQAVEALVKANLALRRGIGTREADGELHVLVLGDVVAFDAGLTLLVFSLGEGTTAGRPGRLQGIILIAAEIRTALEASSLLHSAEHTVERTVVGGAADGCSGDQAEGVGGEEEECRGLHVERCCEEPEFKVRNRLIGGSSSGC